MLGGREPSLVLSEVVQRENYVALWRMLRRYPGPGKNLGRYFFGWGEYPYRCRVRTPRGEVAPTLYSHHDMWTVNEVFCREDYAAGPSLRVVVDIGSNIGISALYFLTRNPTAHVFLYEPDPRNVARLRQNLRGYEGRYTVHEEAVSDFSGTVSFGVEQTGRYGGIGLELDEQIAVPCSDINDVLRAVLARRPRVDILKVDSEGHEHRTIRAISPELARRVTTIYYEAGGSSERLRPDLYDWSRKGDCHRLTLRAGL
jgi:FkbM family methyltransferase